MHVDVTPRVVAGVAQMDETVEECYDPDAQGEGREENR